MMKIDERMLDFGEWNDLPPPPTSARQHITSVMFHHQLGVHNLASNYLNYYATLLLWKSYRNKWCKKVKTSGVYMLAVISGPHPPSWRQDTRELMRQATALVSVARSTMVRQRSGRGRMVGRRGKQTSWGWSVCLVANSFKSCRWNGWSNKQM